MTAETVSPPQRPPAHPRHVAALAAGMFVVGYGTNVSTPFLVLYRDRLELGPTATQAIFGVYVAGIMATLLFVGPLSDRFGRRAIVVPSIALSAVASLLLIPGRNSFALLLLGRVLLGVVSGAVLSVGSAWFLELMGPGHEQRAALYATIATYGGFGFGPLVSAGFERVGLAPLVAPFLLHSIVTMIVLFGVVQVPDRRAPVRGGPLVVRVGVPPGARHMFLLVIVPAAIWVFSFPSTAFALFPVLLSSFIDGSEVAVAAASGTLTALSGLFARPLIGRTGPRSGLVVGLTLGATGYLLGTVAFASETWVPILPAACLLGAASGTLTAGCLTLLGELADDSTRGSLTSAFYLLAYPGMAMPMFVTAIATGIGTTAALVLITLMASSAALAVSRTVRLTAPARAVQAS